MEPLPFLTAQQQRDGPIAAKAPSVALNPIHLTSAPRSTRIAAWTGG